MKKCIRRLLGILFFVLVFQVMFSSSSVFAGTLLKQYEFDLSTDSSEKVDFYLPSSQYVVAELYFYTSTDLAHIENANVTLDEYGTKIQSKKVPMNREGYQYFLSNRKLAKGRYSFEIENLGVREYKAYCDIYAYPSYSSSITFSTNNVTMIAGDDKNITYKGSPAGSYCAISSVVSSNDRICAASMEFNLGTKKYDIYLDAIRIGKTVIKVKLRTGKTFLINVTVIPPSKPKLNEDSIDLNTGDKKQLILYHSGTGKVKWKSSKKSIATVSSKGVVKAKNAGSCKITATYKGKKYVCYVDVVRRKPDVFASLDDYYTRSNSFEVRFTNMGNKTLTILSGKKVLQDDYKKYDRNVRLKKKVQIKPGKTKKVRFYVNGGTTLPDVDSFSLLYKFKYDGKTYEGRVSTEDSYYKNGKKWKDSCFDAELYNYWLYHF